jgi:hypothetical protein
VDGNPRPVGAASDAGSPESFTASLAAWFTRESKARSTRSSFGSNTVATTSDNSSIKRPRSETEEGVGLVSGVVIAVCTSLCLVVERARDDAVEDASGAAQCLRGERCRGDGGEAFASSPSFAKIC